MHRTATNTYDPMPANGDQAEISAWADRYLARHGLPPIAGGSPEGDGTDGGDQGAGGDGTQQQPDPATGTPAGGDDAAAQAAAAAAAGGQGGDDPENWDQDRAMATIRAQRAAEDRLKAEKKALQEKVDAAEREKLTDEEKREADEKAIRDENERLKRENREARLEASLAGNPEVADAELVTEQLLRRGLEFGDDGRPKDLDTKLSEVFEAKPLLKTTPGETPNPDPANGGGSGNGSSGGNGSGSPQGGAPGTNAGAGSGGQGAPPQLSADEVEAANEAGMTPERFQALKEAKTIEDMEKIHADARAAAAGN